MKKLIIQTKLIGLDPKIVNVCYKKGSLEYIDDQTMKYWNKIKFFEQEKSNIQRTIKRQEKELNIIIPPTDIILDSSTNSPIYIEENERKISPLFQTIQIHGKSILLTEYLYPLFKAKLYVMYQLDKECTKNVEYISLFKGLEEQILEHLELGFGFVTEQEYVSIFNFLKQKGRYSSIARYLLSNIWKMPLKPYNQRPEQKPLALSRTNENTYRSPYKEE